MARKATKTMPGMTYIGGFIEEELHKAIKNAAKANDRPLFHEIRQRLRRTVEADKSGTKRRACVHAGTRSRVTDDVKR